MEYRKFAEIPEKVSLLGFGGMRFPVRDDQPENIVEEGVQALIDHARPSGSESEGRPLSPVHK